MRRYFVISPTNVCIKLHIEMLTDIRNEEIVWFLWKNKVRMG